MVQSPNHFIASLSPLDLQAIAGDLEEVTLKRNERIVEAGSSVVHAYFPLTAILSVITVMRNGGQVESRTMGRDSGHGLLHALGAAVSHERVVVQVGGQSLRIPLAALRAAASNRPSLAHAIATHAQAGFVQLSQSVACNVLHPTSERFARWLLMTRDRLGSDVLPLTQEHLAIMLGVQRTTVTAVAQPMQKAGLIAYSRGKITIRDVAGLRRRSCECYDAVRRTVDATVGTLRG